MFSKKSGIKSDVVQLMGFLGICTTLFSIQTIFDWNDKLKTGRININYDELTMIFAYLMDEMRVEPPKKSPIQPIQPPSSSNFSENNQSFDSGFNNQSFDSGFNTHFLKGLPDLLS